MAYFDFRYENHNPYIQRLVSGTTQAALGTSDIGKLIVQGSSIVSVDRVELPNGSTANTMKVVGILKGFPAGTTAVAANSTVPVYIQPIKAGDILQANYSTTIEASTGTNAMVTTNIGYWFGLGVNDGTIKGKYVDPSVATTAVVVSSDYNTHFLRLVGFSTQNDMCWFTVNSSHIAD